jgi:hypothetical protein
MVTKEVADYQNGLARSAGLMLTAFVISSRLHAPSRAYATVLGPCRFCFLRFRCLLRIAGLSDWFRPEPGYRAYADLICYISAEDYQGYANRKPSTAASVRRMCARWNFGASARSGPCAGACGLAWACPCGPRSRLRPEPCPKRGASPPIRVTIPHASIALAQLHEKTVAAEAFQLWRLSVHPGSLESVSN